MENTEVIEKKPGKKMFVLKSFIRKDGKDFNDGYLLFPSPEKANAIVEMCDLALNDPNHKVFSGHVQPFYEMSHWVLVSDFYASQVAQRGSMFVRNLDDATANIEQDGLEVWVAPVKEVVSEESV